LWAELEFKKPVPTIKDIKMASDKDFPVLYTPLFQHSIRMPNTEESRMDLDTLFFGIETSFPTLKDYPTSPKWSNLGILRDSCEIGQSIDADNTTDYDLAMGDDAREDVKATAGRVDAIC
jgi:hypothetical protein